MILYGLGVHLAVSVTVPDSARFFTGSQSPNSPGPLQPENVCPGLMKTLGSSFFSSSYVNLCVRPPPSPKPGMNSTVYGLGVQSAVSTISPDAARFFTALQSPYVCFPAVQHENPYPGRSKVLALRFSSVS